MRLLGGSSTTSVVLSTALAVSLFAGTTLAADSSLPNLSSLANQPAATTSTDSSKPSSTVDSQSTSRSPKATITNTGSVATGVTISAPSITGPGDGATDTGRPRLTGLPKVAGEFTYPPASVPPTDNAPYMQVSKLPEGTVFIAVGSFLALLSIAVLAWRGLVALSLHRAVKRAATYQDTADTKARFRTPAAPMFMYSDLDSAQSLSNLGGGAKGGKRTRPSTSTLNVPSAAQSLFFSPTAGAAGAGMSHVGNRGSNYLPAGYYAAGTAAPGNGTGMAHIGSTENITLSNLRPQSQGYAHPPESPGYPPSIGHRLNNSMNSIDLNPRTTAARAPSVYLEELFNESGGAPEVPPLPPQGYGRF
jgi:hypothetical protein